MLGRCLDMGGFLESHLIVKVALKSAGKLLKSIPRRCFFCGSFLSPDPKRIGGYSDQPGVRPSVRLSVRLSVRRQKLVRSITFIPFEIF